MSRLPTKRNLIDTRRVRLDESMQGIESGYYDPSGAILPLIEPAPPAPIPRSVLPLIFDKVLNFFRPQRSDGRSDYVGDAKAAARSLPRGAPPDPVMVYPAWESRLVNMRDFLNVRSAELAAPGTNTFTFLIPQGYTAFWKEFRYFFEPLPAGVTSVDVIATLLIDDTPVPDYTNLPLGAFMSDFQKTFVIAGSGRRIQVQLVIGIALPAGTVGRVFFYGNMRLRTGFPENQQVGEKLPAPPPMPSVPATVAPPKTVTKGRVLHAGRRS